MKMAVAMRFTQKKLEESKKRRAANMSADLKDVIKKTDLKKKPEVTKETPLSKYSKYGEEQ
jgi:hypothetical protein